MTCFLSRSHWRMAANVAVLILLSGIGAVTLDLVPSALLTDLRTVNWPHSFSQQAWQDHPGQRYHMAVDVTRSGMLEGKSQLWLQDVLGEPSEMDVSVAGGWFRWDVPSPRHPQEQLVVYVNRGVVSKWGVAPKGGVF